MMSNSKSFTEKFQVQTDAEDHDDEAGMVSSQDTGEESLRIFSQHHKIAHRVKHIRAHFQVVAIWNFVSAKAKELF